MSEIKIGTSNGKPVMVDVQALQINKLLVTAASGHGKSYLLRLLAERLFGEVQVIIIDWDGDFVTLQEKFAFATIGKGRNIHVKSSQARGLGEIIHRNGISAVLDTSEFDHESGERNHFVAEFLSGVYNSAEKLRSTKDAHYCQIIVDEAHNFAPEEKLSPKPEPGTPYKINPVYASRSILRRINSQGRARWLGLAESTQRLAKLDKTSIDGLKNQIFGYFALQNDQQVAKKQLGLGAGEFELIRQLAPGEFFAYGSAFGTRETFKMIIDKVTTFHPQPGQLMPVKSGAKPSELLAKISAQIAQIPDDDSQAPEVASDTSGKRQKRFSSNNVPNDGKEVLALKQEIERLQSKVVAVEHEKERANHLAIQMRETNERLAKVREYLKPQYDALGSLFAELGTNGKADNVVSDAGVYDAWMKKLRGTPRKMLGAFVERGKFSKQSLGIYLQLRRESVRVGLGVLTGANLVKLNRETDEYELQEI